MYVNPCRLIRAYQAAGSSESSAPLSLLKYLTSHPARQLY